MIKQGMTVLHLAASEGHLPCIRLLVEQYGFDVNQPSKSLGWRPVHLCCGQIGHHTALRCLNYLISVGADPSLYEFSALYIMYCSIVIVIISDTTVSYNLIHARGKI